MSSWRRAATARSSGCEPSCSRTSAPIRETSAGCARRSRRRACRGPTGSATTPSGYVPPSRARGRVRPIGAPGIPRRGSVSCAPSGRWPSRSAWIPAGISRKNYIRRDESPWQLGLSSAQVPVVYDSGDYEAALDAALNLARYRERRAEQAAERARGDHGRLLGIGVAGYVLLTG